MKAKEFDLIIIESLLHEARQTYFNAKREQFKCNPDEYFTGLMNSFKRLNDEVNKTDYFFAIVTTPEGEEREYDLSSDSLSEQIIFLGTIGKVSFPNKKPLDLRSFTDGKFNGYLTDELMAGLWPDLHKYCQSIIDEKTKTIQEIRGELQKSEIIKEDEHPDIFKEGGCKVFRLLNERYTKSDKKLPTKYSHLYHYLKYEDLLNCTQLEYIAFIKSEYNVTLSKIQPKTYKYDYEIQSLLKRYHKGQQ